MIVMTSRPSQLVTRSVAIVVGAVLAGAVLSGCGTGERPGAGSDRLEVAAAFYPLEYAVSRVGGDHVDVTSLTKPGAEPHDVELTPRQVGSVASADLVVYERHFQPAVDDAVHGQARDHSLDVSPAARLTLTTTEDDHSGESAAEHDAHAGEGGPDPHFWLDPMRYADVGDAIAAELGRRDPAHATAYRSNAQAFRAQLTTLHDELTAGLAHCAVHDLVTSHAAFGYLAQAYGFTQVSISGLTPDAEPNPAAMAALTDHIRESGATTVYAETLVSRAVATTLARETGARLAVLDPLEGITSASAGRDYPSVMRANLATLRAGQECS
jgi:zinc transport system substrate-binding protein